MADLNKVMLIWRITTDLEVKKMWDSGNSVLNFSLASNRSWKNKNWEKVEETEFTRCVVFWKLADVMEQYLSKWKKIFIEWRLRTRQWEDQSWTKKFTTEVIVNEMNFCEGLKSNWKIEKVDEDKIEDEEVPF